MTDNHDFHPLANIFPLMEGAEFDALVTDIKAHGLLEPIVLYQGKILDGRNRELACEKAGIEPRYRTLGDHDAAAYVVSMNVRRRHLTSKQKREVIAALLKVDPTKSDRQIAETAGVDNKTVASVRTEKEGREEIPHVDKRKDSAGRAQPAGKPPKKTPEASSATPLGVPTEDKPDGLNEDQHKTNADGTPIRRIAAPARYTPRDTNDPEAVANAANVVHRKLMGFLKAFEPDLKAWLKTKPTENGIEMMHNALIIAEEKLNRMAGDVRDARSTLLISKKAEIDNATPADASGEEMKVKMAGLQ